MACWLCAAAGIAGRAENLPQFDEVYQLLRTHLHASSDTNLNRAAVQGILAQLGANAMIVPADAAAAPSPSLGQSLIFDDSYACFRVLKVQPHLAEDLMTAYRQVTSTNKTKIKGVVLDLRFATGSDFMAAASAADCFLNADQPLLECGGQTARSTKKDNAITVPIAALINAKTTEAAEGLAAVLRETSTGLLLGSQTAGRANLFQDFPLANGEKLRIAVGEIKLADGSVFTGGVKPDIAVEVAPADEYAYWEHPYQSPILTATNGGAARLDATNTVNFRRFNEAELVREQRDGADLEAEFTGRARFQPDPALNVLKDPLLSRALDLLKGLAVVQQGHPG
jgi:carboxyl-terminal processing protease